MTLTFLGTGTSSGVPALACDCRVCTSSDPHDKRTRPSILLEYDGLAVVIDTTPDFRAQALREQLQRLDAVVFTHSHADHILGLDDVRNFYFRRQQPIPIYADERSMQAIQRTFKYIFDGNYPYGGIAKLDPHVIDGPFVLGSMRFVPIPVLHGNLPILGFRFGDVAYLTDVSEIPNTTLPLLQDLDILILDTLRHKPHPTHLTVEQSLEVVKNLNARRAFFTHISHDLAHEETNASLPSYTRLAFDGLKLEI